MYCYPVEHYEYWMRALPGRELPPGAFGENFTTAGLVENAVQVGDRLSVGSAEVVVTQPRLPCYKLGVRFQSDQMVKRFLHSGRPGFYVSVAREGTVGAGDAIAVMSREPNAVSIADLMGLFLAKAYTADEAALAERAVRLTALPDYWRDELRSRLQTAR